MLNDDAVKEMDRDVAKDFLEMQGVTVDLKPSLKEPVAERPPTASKKSVSFAQKPETGKMNPTEASDYRESLAQELLQKAE